MGKIKQIPHRAKVHLLEDSLKTLEDKVKFIMKNTDKEIFNQTSMQEADSKWVTLQDLWDEKDEVDMSSSTSVLPENHTFTDGGNSLCPHGFPYKSAASYCSCKEPTVKECPIPNCICKTDGIHFTVNKFGNTYIIEPTVKEYPCKCDCHKEMTKEELYPDDRPIANCGLCCLDKPTVKECEHHFCLTNTSVCCKCGKERPVNNSEKIEEIISRVLENCFKPSANLESWLRDKLKSL